MLVGVNGFFLCVRVKEVLMTGASIEVLPDKELNMPTCNPSVSVKEVIMNSGTMSDSGTTFQTITKMSYVNTLKM